MKNYLKLLLAGLLVFAVAMGCKKEEETTQKVAPQSAGERGSSCDSKNDCGTDLSCILGICQPADFTDLEASMKECYRLDCETAADCCGDRATEAPAHCRGRDATCEPDLPGCESDFSMCFGDSDCGGGAACGGRTCNFSGLTCGDDTDCDDVCEFPAGAGGTGPGTCSVSGDSCLDDFDCFYNGDSCDSGFCSCANPDYNPLDPICTDETCDDVCTLVCDQRRCVEDTSCESDDDCVVGDRNICSASTGECIECESTADCDDPDDDEDDDHECNTETGTCFQPCRGDAECGMMQACQEDGTCEYVGCRSDQECILLGIGAGIEDQRLLTCNIDEEGIGTCSIECEIDAHCPGTHVCDEGVCQYIGCQADTDCYSLLGLNNWERTSMTPWTPTAVCTEETPEGITIE